MTQRKDELVIVWLCDSMIMQCNEPLWLCSDVWWWPAAGDCTLSRPGLTSLCPHRDIWPAAAGPGRGQELRAAPGGPGTRRAESDERRLGSVLRLPSARPLLGAQELPSWVLSGPVSSGLWLVTSSDSLLTSLMSIVVKHREKQHSCKWPDIIW